MYTGVYYIHYLAGVGFSDFRGEPNEVQNQG